MRFREVVLIALGSSLLWAQGELATARLAGTVLDPGDAVIPDAKVTLSSPDSGFTRQFTTGVDGQYGFTLISPGRYQLKVEKTGFHAWLQSNIILVVGQNSTLHPRLELGAITQVVEVHADAPLLNTGNAALGSLVSSKQAVELPLNIRNVFSLVLIDSSVNNQQTYQGIT